MALGREALAEERLIRILRRHGIATARTLEQKISDAGPGHQRIDPHILTPVRGSLQQRGIIASETHAGTPWFYLADTPRSVVDQRLAEQLPIVQGIRRGDFGIRLGQCLEIAIHKALIQQSFLSDLGSFTDLDEHDDSLPYSKDEPPQYLGGKRLAGKQRLDFLVQHPEAGWAALEAKNTREWIYPNRSEIKELLTKAITLDCVPVLIARRIHFVTVKLLSTCGVITHQNYNQLYPKSNNELADRARHRNLLGFHDIRVGNEPDGRLVKFVETNLPAILPKMRKRFDEFKDLLEGFADSNMEYDEFAARVRRRADGTNEDGDWDLLEMDI